MGVWHQVAVVADRAAGTMTTYLDGVQTARSTGLTSAFTLTSGFPFTVGAEGSGTDQGDGFVNAFVDDFDFYDSVVSADQIQNDFRATRPATGPATPGSTVPAGFTYLGQFLDHDLTFDKSRLRDDASVPVADLIAGRSPSLDLDSLYGLGPTLTPEFYAADKVHLRIGATVRADFPQDGIADRPQPGQPSGVNGPLNVVSQPMQRSGSPRRFRRASRSDRAVASSASRRRSSAALRSRRRLLRSDSSQSAPQSAARARIPSITNPIGISLSVYWTRNRRGRLPGWVR